MARSVGQKSLPLVLIVLDGWGYSARKEHNAVAQADTPHLRELGEMYPSTFLQASGEAVGLPAGIIGNSEVGHICLGAGRVVYQELSRINQAIKTHQLERNSVLQEHFSRTKAGSGRLHLMGLVSDGGVHSHIDHLLELVRLAHASGIPDIFIHAFTDGRDTSPRAGIGHLRTLEAFLAKEGAGAVATVTGRYYAMDRDQRWDRTRRAYRALVFGEGKPSPRAREAIQASYDLGVTDEFVLPSVIEVDGDAGRGSVRKDDSILFFNFRADRARQLTRAFTEKNFSAFETGPRPLLSSYCGLTLFHRDFEMLTVFPPQNVEGNFGQALAAASLPQLRLAETEKYAHVTFFFNGGEEKAYSGEERILVPSPKVATYDLRPEMSAAGVTDELVRKLGDGKDLVVILNLANCDMVGHTGVFEATVRAVETVDRAVGRIVKTVLGRGGTAVITADHGNAEQMVDFETGGPHTAHTTNPVPLLLVNPQLKSHRLRGGGLLADVAPTLLDILNLELPEEMEGRSLLEG